VRGNRAEPSAPPDSRRHTSSPMKVVATSPLKVQFSGLHSKFCLSQPEPGQLRLLPNLGVRVLAWLLCVLGWPLLILALLALIALLSGRKFGRFDPFEHVMGIFVLLIFGVPLSFGGVVLLGRRFAFDSRTGEMTMRHFWRTRRRPLTDIVAVQVLNGGVFSSGAKRVISYQLNLVLDDASEPRLFVAYNCDEADILEKSKLLAEFLRVPHLVENLSDQGGRSDATRKKSHKIRKDKKAGKRLLTACLLFAGAVLGAVAAGTWLAFSPGGQGGEPSGAQSLAVIIMLLCVFASVVNVFVAYGRVCWFYRCPTCGKRLTRPHGELGPIQYRCDSCGVLWDTGWELSHGD
jgi:hypothetical protein